MKIRSLIGGSLIALPIVGIAALAWHSGIFMQMVIIFGGVPLAVWMICLGWKLLSVHRD